MAAPKTDLGGTRTDLGGCGAESVRNFERYFPQKQHNSLKRVNFACEMFRGDGKQETVSGAYNHVLKYMGLFGGVQGITVLLSMVRNKFVSVLLGREGLGLIDMYNKAMDLFLLLPVLPVYKTALIAYEHHLLASEE